MLQRPTPDKADLMIQGYHYTASLVSNSSSRVTNCDNDNDEDRYSTLTIVIVNLYLD